MKLTKEQKEILSHTIKNRFYCGGGEAMDELCASGLMCCAGKKGFAPDMYYRITEAGRCDAFLLFKEEKKETGG